MPTIGKKVFQEKKKKNEIIDPKTRDSHDFRNDLRYKVDQVS